MNQIVYFLPVKGSRFFGPRWEIILDLCLTNLTSRLSNRLLCRSLYAGFTNLKKIFFISPGFNPFLVLKTYVAIIWKLLWEIVTVFSFFRSSLKGVTRSAYTIRIALSWILFIRLFNILMSNIHANGQYRNWEKMKVFIITLSWLKFI